MPLIINYNDNFLKTETLHIIEEGFAHRLRVLGLNPSTNNCDGLNLYC